MARGPRTNRIVVGGLAGEIDYDDADFEGLDSEIQRMFYGDRAGIDGVDLDSHVLLWLLTSRRELGPRADALVHGTDGVYVSVASVWELTIKAIRHAGAIRDFPEIADPDPFDRLAAQAHADGHHLLTADRVLLGLGRRFVVDATV